jgi:hypothetical protein
MKTTLLLLAIAALSPLGAGAQVNFDSASATSLSALFSGQNLAIPEPAVEQVRETRSCEGYPLRMRLRGRTVTLPATGLWTLESHLATSEDRFPSNRSFPRTTRENIYGHLANSCDLLMRNIPGANCDEVYNTKWDKVWTPPENGKAGQGSLGDIRPSKEEEMWIFNMMWVGSSMPKAGTKFLATFNGRSVVVVGGYERGPSSRHFLGGFQKEVLWALRAEHDSSKVTLSALLDQSLPPGPVECPN